MAGSPNFAAGLVDNIKRSVVTRVIAGLVVVAGLAFGGSLLWSRFGPHGASPAVAVTPIASPARSAGAPSASAPVLVAGVVKPGAIKPASANAASRPGTPAQAVNDGTRAPMVTAVPQSSQQPGSNLVHLDDHLTYQYNALGRRDPFQSLVDGQFVGADVGGDAPPDPGGIKIVGIVWGATDQFALAEDVRGNSFVLRKGDKVQNGYVLGLKRDGVIVNITSEGQSQSVVIPLVRKGEQNAR